MDICMKEVKKLNFIIALDISDNTFIMCDEQGKQKIKIKEVKHNENKSNRITWN